jgi:hypothetical protein
MRRLDDDLEVLLALWVEQFGPASCMSSAKLTMWRKGARKLCDSE